MLTSEHREKRVATRYQSTASGSVTGRGVMRSKLFVPCTRPEFFAKALAGSADAISFDLEDSVPEAAKDAARAQLRDFLGSDAGRTSGKRIIVRINALGTPHFAADLAALAGLPVHLVNLPKADRAEDVRTAAAALEAAAAPGDAAPPMGLLLNIETPRALASAAAIAGAHPRVAGLQAGLNDLFEPLGIARSEPTHVHAALWAVRLGSAEAGCFALDGAYADVADEAGFRREAELARSLGFLGKSCIHPSQVAIANAVFDRGIDLANARRIVAAAREAAALGRGAFLLDGRMIDRPAIAHAEAVLAASESAR
jgi:citrate lyase subunit beta/citryl-CoA lyase